MALALCIPYTVLCLPQYLQRPLEKSRSGGDYEDRRNWSPTAGYMRCHSKWQP